MTVKQTQCLMAYLGYYTGQIDGQWGGMSTAACRAFQADYGLTADGICGSMTQKMLIGAIAGTAAKVERPAEAEQETTDKAQTGTFWDGIKWFKREEFKCKCGGRYCNGYPAEIDMDMVRDADAIRERLGVPLRVNSGLRCRQWNQIQKGAANSRHLYGDACDLGKPEGVTVDKMLDVAEDVVGSSGGVGAYNWGIHIDKRGSKARWDER